MQIIVHYPKNMDAIKKKISGLYSEYITEYFENENLTQESKKEILNETEKLLK